MGGWRRFYPGDLPDMIRGCALCVTRSTAKVRETWELLTPRFAGLMFLVSWDVRPVARGACRGEDRKSEKRTKREEDFG